VRHLKAIKMESNKKEDPESWREIKIDSRNSER